MHKTTARAAFALSVAALLVLSGCSAPSSDDGADSDIDTLRVAMAEVTSNLDPATYNVPANNVLMAGAVGYLVSYAFGDFPDDAVYDGAVPVVETDNYVPELAESWEFADDNLSLTMKLREGVLSPYGNELTAEDVKWTAERNVALTTVGNFGMTVGKIDKENPVTVIDDYTVQWNLTETSPLLVKIMTWSWFAPIDSVEAQKNVTADDPWATEWLSGNTAFFGPYHVTEFDPGQSVTLEVNENYWDAAPEIERIVMQTVPDAGSRQQLVQRGEVDFVADVPRQQLVALQGESDVQVILSPSLRFSYLQYNVNVEPLGDKLVRQAISYAIPYDTILEDAYQGTSLPAETVGMWLPNASDATSPYEFDLDKARELLTEAGYPDGFAVNLTYSMANPGPENEQAAVLIANSLAEIGIDVTLVKPSSEADFGASYSSGEFQMAIAGLSPGAPDLGYALFVMAHSGGFQNFGKFAGPAEFDELLIDGISNPDEQERQQSMAQALEMYHEYVPATPIADPLVGIVASPRVQGVQIGVWAHPYWKYVTLSE